jgi:hypothetical protein
VDIMAKLKILLPYIFGLVSLIISLGVVSQGKPTAVEKLPYPTPTATPHPNPEPFPGAARLARCQALSQPRFFFYIPSETDEAEPYLTITGTIYASDLTPLPDAAVEIWRTETEQRESPYPPPTQLFFPTDEVGHYQFTTIKPTRPEQAYLHLQFVYQGYCPLLVYLGLVTEPRPKPAKQSAFAKVIEVTGPVLQGPLDIVLPVPPPKP